VVVDDFSIVFIWLLDRGCFLLAFWCFEREVVWTVLLAEELRGLVGEVGQGRLRAADRSLELNDNRRLIASATRLCLTATKTSRWV